MSGYSNTNNSFWETPLFYVSPGRQQCMDRQVSQCTPLPSGDVPNSRQLQDFVYTSSPKEEDKRERKDEKLKKECEECCPVYTVGGYKNPFPDYMVQMRGDNDFYFRQDACQGSFLPLFQSDTSYNAMDYLYRKKNIK
jgi:hypothetical protein